MTTHTDYLAQLAEKSDYYFDDYEPALSKQDDEYQEQLLDEWKDER